MKKLGIILAVIVTLLSSCATTKDTVRMTVASEKRMAMGVVPMEVLLVKEGDAKDWTYFHSNIDGFAHENGYEYVLEVKKESRDTPVPADASSIKYTLVKEVSKTQKTSENMLKGIPSTTVNKYVWTGKVIEIEDADVGVGAAKGKFPVQVVKIEVTALNSTDIPFKEGAIIFAELIAEPTIMPELEREYVFKAKDAHPAHILGVYMLDTNVQDLTR